MRKVVSDWDVYWEYAYKKHAVKRKEELKNQGIVASVVKTSG